MRGLMTQFSMGVNMYPESIVKAIDILTNHKFDKKEPKNNNNGNGNQRNKNRNDNDTASITTQSSFNQEETKNAQCYCCSKKGHYTNKCPENGKRPKDQWAVKKATMHVQATQIEKGNLRTKKTTTTRAKHRKSRTKAKAK
jgi:hypothetical protein